MSADAEHNDTSAEGAPTQPGALIVGATFGQLRRFGPAIERAGYRVTAAASVADLAGSPAASQASLLVVNAALGTTALLAAYRALERRPALVLLDGDQARPGDGFAPEEQAACGPDDLAALLQHRAAATAARHAPVPTAPVEPEPTAPLEPEPTEPVEQVEPEPTEPVEQVEPEPTEPVEQVDLRPAPLEPEPVEQVEPEPVEPVEQVDLRPAPLKPVGSSAEQDGGAQAPAAEALRPPAEPAPRDRVGRRGGATTLQLDTQARLSTDQDQARRPRRLWPWWLGALLCAALVGGALLWAPERAPGADGGSLASGGAAPTSDSLATSVATLPTSVEPTPASAEPPAPTAPSGGEVVVVPSNDGAAVDLTIEIVEITPQQPAVGDVVNVRVRVRNTGTEEVTEPFWLDLYVSPQSEPAINQAWPDLSAYGATWLIDRLGAGESRTLETLDADQQRSNFLQFPTAGQQQLYALVDSYGATSDGAIAEQDEENNLTGPFSLSVTPK